MHEIIGNSLWARRTRELIARIAPTDVSVLIAGRTGTGKEVAARAIHALSPRRDGPFVPVNCGAVPPSLSGSQFFGHVKGAFSGACCAARGSFLEANGGTLFLDEVGELRPRTQALLLRVIQERVVTPLGTQQEIPLDVRIVAATNRDLWQDVAARRFREDLYYRLVVVTLPTTPLSERPEDVAPLCRHFLERRSRKNKLPAKRLSAEALELLMACEWPGNVRELQNVLERAAIFSDAEEISAEQVRAALERTVPPAIAGHTGEVGGAPRSSHGCPESSADSPLLALLRRDRFPTLAAVESCMIREALQLTFYNKCEAARLLGIDRQVLSRKAEKLGISVSRRAARAA